MKEKLYRIHIKQGEYELDVEGDRGFVEAYVESFLAEKPVQKARAGKPAKAKGAAKGKKEVAKKAAGRKAMAKAAPKAKAPAAPKKRKATRTKAKAKVAAKPKPKVKKAAKAKAGAPKRKPVPVVDKKAIRAFMKGKNPRSDKERYLAYALFWKDQGVKEVADAHIQACFTAHGRVVPRTGRQYFLSLKKEGMLVNGSARGLWAVTPKAVKEGAVFPKAKAAKRKAAATKAKATNKAGKTTRRRRAPKSVAEVMGYSEKG